MSRQFDHLPDSEVFTTVAELGSFSAAAISLSTTPSVLSRAVTRLEDRLGCQLLRRTTRQLHLTEAGKHYLQELRAAFELIKAAEGQIQGQDGPLTGKVRLSVPTTYGHYRLPRMLKQFCDAHPDVQVDLNISNRNVDLNAEGFDLAIRLGELPDSNLLGRKLEEAKLCLVASPAYLAQQGLPKKLNDLSQHQCLPFLMPSTGRAIPWLLRENNKDIEWKPHSRIHLSDDVLGVVSLAEQGLGICQTFRFIAEDLLKRNLLLEVLPELQGRSRPFSIIYTAQQHRSAASRALIEHLVRAASELRG